ncbi:inositol phosphorylceramide synthase subunit Kei1 [Rhizoctonia solani]|uniref:Inositol phosphorylceramide synthase subunit Kei1 n=1 Tax=Rhizoctonia solani TaxID=456999 RepID=A0A8H8SU57_9AGAM|nr:inositol phosphorylceramide synthase subunit Kei1 [Rhizoctonia solani]QRW17007.1 inositol phosphorylceramide synthase subunit Kei1 [Rhizoctonia solani]
MAVLCSIGGITGFARTKSIPSLVAGVGVGGMYGYAGYQIRNGGNYGYETALAASVILFLSSVPRARKGPVPLTLSITSAAAAIYYAKVVYDFRFTMVNHEGLGVQCSSRSRSRSPSWRDERELLPYQRKFAPPTAVGAIPAYPASPRTPSPSRRSSSPAAPGYREFKPRNQHIMGVTMILLFALINKVAGVYGLVSLFFGGSAAQISMYVYSSLAIVALAWGLKAVTDEDPKRTFYFAHIFVADHLLGTIWTVFFAVLWWVYNPHDGEKVVNSAAQEAMAGAHGNTTMTHEERVAAAQLIWNKEKGLAAAVLIAGWISKIYFAALIYSYATHLRQGSYRTLPMTAALANSISNNGDNTLMESDLESDDETDGSTLYRMPVRTPRTGDNFAEFSNGPSRGRKPGTSKGSKLGEPIDSNEEEVLWDEEEERAGASGMSSKLETESDLSSSTDPEAQVRPSHIR